MKDPLRIPRVLEALSQAWEAQPDMTLPQLFGVLETRGIAWNSTDEEVLDVLSALNAERPLSLPSDAPGRYLVETEQPDYRVTLDPWWAAVRPSLASRSSRPGPGTGPPQPAVWRHGGVRRCAVGQPLTVLSADGHAHRFGLVNRIAVLSRSADGPLASPDLSGLRSGDLDGHVYHLQLAGDEQTGTSVLVDRSMWVFDVSRREVHRDRVRWSRLVSARVGSELVVDRRDGPSLRLPTVERITVMQ